MELFDLTATEILMRLLLGLVIGFCIGLTGVGGGILAFPVITVLLKIDPIIAVGTTTLYAFLTNISATFQHLRLRSIDWKISAGYLAGAVPAAALSALWVSNQTLNPEFQHRLRFFIGCIVIFSIGLMLLTMLSKGLSKTGSPRFSPAGFIRATRGLRPILSVFIGSICGGLIGATSIGAGVLIVPTLLVFFGLSARRTVGSTIFIAFILASVTAAIYGFRGAQDLQTAAIMAVGSVGGTYLGSRLSNRLPNTLLQTLMIALVLASATLLFLGHRR